MPDEIESPSVGWRAVYHEMGVSTVAETTTTVPDERFSPLVDTGPSLRTPTATPQVIVDNE